MTASEESDRLIANDSGKPNRAWGPWMSVIAVALSAIVLVAAVVPGLVAPRSVMAQSSRGGIVAIGSVCTHYPGAEVTLTAPGGGTIVVSATVGVGVNHSFGIGDETWIVVAASATECSMPDSTPFDSTAFVSVPATLPTDRYHYETVPLLRSFSVQGGPHTFYVNAFMAQGAGVGDRFDSASLVAVFYPA